MPKFLVSYRLDGAEWNIELPAADEADARRRLGQLMHGRVEGELIAKVPGALGPLAALTVGVRNLLSASR